MTPPSTLRQVCSGCIVALFATQSGLCVNAYWNVDGIGNWATAANPPWLGGTAPGSTSSTTNIDVANFGFGLTADRVVTVDANRNIGGITFSNASVYKYTLSGGNLLLSNGGVIRTLASNGDHVDTISTAIAIQGDGGSATFTGDADSGWSTMSLGAVTGVSTAGKTTTLTLNGTNVGSTSGENTITGVSGNGTGTGTLALTKSGGGTWSLSGTNTFTGQLTVADGILKVGTVNGSGAAGVFGNSALSVILGKSGTTGTLEYSGATASSSKKFTLATGGTGTFQVDTFGAILTVSGAIDGSGTLAKTGTGTLTLSGTNIFTGPVYLYEGVLSLGSAGALGTSTSKINFGGGTLQFSAGNQTDCSARFSTDAGQAYSFDTNGRTVTLASNLTSAAGTLAKSGTGTLTLAGTNTYGGGTTVTAGTLAVTGKLGANTGALTVDGSTAIFSLGASNQTVGAVTVWNGGQITGTTGTLTGTSFDVDGTTASTISAKLAGSGTLIKNNTGGLTLSGVNTYSGGTTVYGGTLTVSASGTLGSTTGELTVNGSAAIVAIGATNQTVGTVNVWNGGSITSTGTGTLTGTAFNVESGTISARLAGTGILTKTDTGTVTLSGINTYTGATRVNVGTLQVTTVASLPGQTTPGKITVANGATLAVSVGAGLFTEAGIADLMANANFAAGSNLGITNAAAFTYAGDLTGSVGISKLGTGVLTLSGSGNTYSGGTTVLAGNLTLSGTATLGNGNGDLTVDAAAIVNLGTVAQTVRTLNLRSGTINANTSNLSATAFNVEAGTIAAKLGGTGALTKSNTGTVTLSGVNTYSGGTAVTDGTLTLSIAGALGDAGGALTVDGSTAILGLGATLQTVGSVRLLGGGQITGTTGKLTGTSFQVENGSISAILAGTDAVLTKSSTETVVLSGANTYTGGTHVNAGMLQAGKATSLGTGATTVAGGATLVVNVGGTGQFTAANITTLLTSASFAANSTFGIDTTNAAAAFACTSSITGSIGLSKLGVGTLTLSGTNTYTGGTLVTAGTLALSGNNKLGATTSALTVDGATSILSLGATTQEVGAVRLLNDAQITGTGTLTGSSFLVESGTISAKLAGAAVLTKDTWGTLTLSGANTFTGGVVLLDGVLALGNLTALGTSGTIRFGSGTLQFSATNKVDYSSRFSTTAGQSFKFDTNGQVVTLASALASTGGTLTKSGLGTLILSGVNTYSGGTTISEGTLQVVKAASLPGLTTNGLITFADSTTLAINAGGVGEFTATNIGNLMANATFPTNSTLSIDTTNGNFDCTSNLTQELKLVKLGINTLTLTKANTYTGGTVIGVVNQANAGALRLSGSGKLGTDGPLVVYGGALELNGTTQTVTALTLGEGSAASTSSIAIGTGELKLAGDLEYRPTTNSNGASISSEALGKLSLLGSRTFLVANSTNAASAIDLTVSSNIQNADATSGALIKDGAGVLLLTGTNTYTGGTAVNAGALQVTASTSLPSLTTPGKITVAAGASLLIKAGGSGEFAATDIANLAANGSFAAGSILGLDTTNAVGGTLTIASNITGGVSITKLGTGTLVLSGTGNTYSGTTTVTAGSFQVDGSLATGGLMTVPSTGILGIAAGSSVARSVTLSGGVLNLGGTLGTGSTLTLTNGTINTVGAAASAAIVVLPVPSGTTRVLSAPVDQELIVTNKLTQTLSSGSITFTAGTTPFEAGGGNLVSNTDTLFLKGGTTKIEQKAGANLAAANLLTTDLVVTGTNILNLGFAGKASLGGLSLAAGTLTFQTAIDVSFNNLTVSDTATIAAGPTLSLRTGNVTVADGKTLTLSPAVVDGTAASVLTKLGTGALILSGANTYSGTTSVNAGTLTLGGANTCTGGTILNGGTLTVTSATALQHSSVTFNGGVLDTGALTNVPLGGITANVDTTLGSVLTTIYGSPTWSAAATKTLSISGNVTRTSGASINFGSTGTISGAGFGTLLGTNTINPWATYGGIDWAVYNGSKIAAYSGYAAATGSASAPTLTSLASANYKIDNTTSNNVTLASIGTININSLVISGSTARTIDLKNGSTPGILRLSAAGGILMGGGTHTIGVSGSAGTLTAGGANTNSAGELIVTASSNATINSVIADNGTGKVALTTYGPSMLTLNGSNTYSGNTTINTGTLGSTSATGNVIPNGLGKGDLFINEGGTLALIGATETINGLNGNGTVYGDAAAAGRLTLGDGNANGTFSGVLRNGATGLLHLVKIGSGTQTLTGSNIYTGTTTVSGGTLALDFSVNNPSSILASTTVLTLNGGTLGIKGKSAGTTAQTVTGLKLEGGNSALSVDANGGGGTLLTLGSITRTVATGGYVNFVLPTGTPSATNGITTTSAVANGILGYYATVGSDWAAKSGNNIIAYTAYTNLAALGSSIASSAATNVRLNTAGTGANIGLTAATITTINTLLQNTTTAATVDTAAGKTLRTSGIMVASGQAALTIGLPAGTGILTAVSAGGELALMNNSTSGNLTINALIQNQTAATPSPLTTRGPGTIVLGGTNTYTGATTVIAGKLTVTGTINTTDKVTILGGEFNYNSTTPLAKAVSLSGSGGILSGTGSLGATTTLQGIHAPGNSGVGIQTFSAGLTYDATSRLQWELADDLTVGRGTNFDGVDVTGGAFSIVPGATIDLSLGAAVDFTNGFWGSDQTWTLVDLSSAATDASGTGVFTLGSITGGGYTSSRGAFTVTRVAGADTKKDVVLKWTAATATPFQAWIANFPSIPVADRDPADDPDHDGANNLAEFAFDGDPSDGLDKGRVYGLTADSSDAGDAMELILTIAVRKTAPAFTTGAPAVSTVDGITYSIEGTLDLTTFGTLVTPVTLINPGLPALSDLANYEYRSFSLTGSNGLPGKGFLRAKVTQP
jgi:autotransporter-associated beta strand protein